MPRGDGIVLDGKTYNLVQDHETYVVADIPAHPDSDSRMERRITYDNFTKGILKRRDAKNALDQSITSLNVFNRIEKAGEGAWFFQGTDTRMGDRLYGQRSVGTSQSLASTPLFIGDSDKYSYIACKQHLYVLNGVNAGVQQVLLSKDFSAINPAVNITDVSVFNGRIYVATAQLTGGVPDPAKVQNMWVWDQTGTTTNWTNPPQPLAQPTWKNSATITTTLSAPVAIGDMILTVVATGGFTANATYVVQCGSEQMLVKAASGTTFTVIQRGFNGTAAATHNTSDVVAELEGAYVLGTSTSTKYQYYVVAQGTGQDSPPSQLVNITWGNGTLSSTNSNTIQWNAVTGATSYTVVRNYSGGVPNSVGVIATGIAGTSYTDQGAATNVNFYQVTPQFAIGDTGAAMGYVVIRNNLWRGAGAKMWSWDGQQATWSGESVIGNPTTNITALDVFQDGLVIFKTDGIYSMDRGGNVFPLFPGFKTLGFNPRPIGQWQGAYYFASDIGMVWRWDGNAINSIGFDYAEAYPFPDNTFGLLNAVTRGVSLPNFLLVGFNKYNSTGNFGFWLAWDGVGWHPFRFDANNQATAAGITGGNVVPAAPYLQFGTTTAGNANGLYYMTNPTIDPVLATSFDTIAQVVYLPVESGIIADEWKIFEGIRTYVQTPQAGTVRIAYAIDDQIDTLSFTDMGVPDGDHQSIQTFTPSGELPSFRKIILRLTITPTASTGTPVVRTIIQRYKQREVQRKSWTLQLFLEEGGANPGRHKEHRTSAKMLQDLNLIRRGKQLVTFKDIVGDSYMVYVERVEESLKTYRGGTGTVTFTCKVVLVEPAELQNV